MHREEPVRQQDPRISNALDALRAGNERFYSGSANYPHLDVKRRRDVSQHGQEPFATIIACSDSRVPVELLFDQGIGDLFVIRVAGHVCGVDATGSIEYAVAHLDCPLVVVLGHRHCGAVTAAIQEVTDTRNISTLLERIQPAVERARGRRPACTEAELLDEAIEENVWQSVGDLLSASRTIHERSRTGGTLVVGAIYDIESGRIRWLGRHPNEGNLLSQPSTCA